MENASKALIFAASTLIAIMLMSIMVYMFRRFGDTAATTEKRMSQEEILAFNAKFINYDTGGDHNLNDTFSITYARTATSNSDTKYITYANLFKDSAVNTVKTQTYYNKALIAASQTLNKGYDVVTAINDAIDTNYSTNNGYTYNPNLEIQNSVEIIVDLGSYKDDFKFSTIKNTSSHYQYLVIEPNRDVKPKYVYGLRPAHTLTTSGTNTKNKEANALNFDGSFINDESNVNYNAISVYDILDELRDTKVVNQDNKSYMVYKYYFLGEVIENEFTGLVETVKFTLVKDKNF